MPSKISMTIAISMAAAGSLMLATSPNEPTEPRVPAGHPAVSMPDVQDTPKEARPEDIKSIDSIVNAYYDSVSGPKGQRRDWNRLLSLFMPDGRFIVSRVVDGETIPMILTPQEFVDTNRTYFEQGGYFEQEIHRETDTFGHIAQVFSTYASRRALSDPEPYSRGINSIQVMNAGDRWWITTIMWESEHPDTNPIPEDYLSDEDSEG